MPKYDLKLFARKEANQYIDLEDDIMLSKSTNNDFISNRNYCVLIPDSLCEDAFPLFRAGPKFALLPGVYNWEVNITSPEAVNLEVYLPK